MLYVSDEDNIQYITSDEMRACGYLFEQYKGAVMLAMLITIGRHIVVMT
jgi:hypothetical protein